MAEPDAVDGLALVAQLQRQVLFTDQALADDLDLFAEHRRRKTLAPDGGVQRVHHVGAPVFGRQRAVGLQPARERGGIQPFGGDLLQRAVEGVEVLFGNGAAGRHGVAAKFDQHAGVALGYQVERVAQVKAGNRAARALEHVGLPRRVAGGEDEGRAVQPVFQPRGDDADHAFVKVGVEHGQGRRRDRIGVEQPLGDLHRLLAHAAFDFAPLAVDAVERGGQLGRARRVVGQQQLDAQRHVGQAAGGVDARAECKAEIKGGGLLACAASY